MKSVMTETLVNSISSNSEFGLIPKDKLSQLLSDSTPLSLLEIETILKLTPESYISVEALRL